MQKVYFQNTGCRH